jgi:hypothetical protein
VKHEISYYRNHKLLYTSKRAPAFPLVVDCSFQSPGGRAEEIHLETEVATVGNGATANTTVDPAADTAAGDIRLSELSYPEEEEEKEVVYDAEAVEAEAAEEVAGAQVQAEAEAAEGRGLFLKAAGTRAFQVALSIDGGAALERFQVCMIGNTMALKEIFREEQQQQQRTHARRVSTVISGAK